jgi:hypothetical protein
MPPHLLSTPRTGPFAAAALSSMLFGLAHSPLFGFSSLVEGTLGGGFALAYWCSGRNLLVPILVHTMYDFGALFLTWLSASKDIEARVTMAEKAIKGLAAGGAEEGEGRERGGTGSFVGLVKARGQVSGGVSSDPLSVRAMASLVRTHFALTCLWSL